MMSVTWVDILIMVAVEVVALYVILYTIIIIHEAGHIVFGKLGGFYISHISLGQIPLIQFSWGDEPWSPSLQLGLLPLGGFVTFGSDNKNPPPKFWRIMRSLGGVIFTFSTAAVLFLYWWTHPELPIWADGILFVTEMIFVGDLGNLIPMEAEDGWSDGFHILQELRDS